MSLRFISVIARESYSNQESFLSSSAEKNDVKASPIRRLQRGKSYWKSVQTGSRRKKNEVLKETTKAENRKKRLRIMFSRERLSQIWYVPVPTNGDEKKFFSTEEQEKKCHHTNIHKSRQMWADRNAKRETITDEKLQWNERIVLSWKNIISSVFFFSIRF